MNLTAETITSMGFPAGDIGTGDVLLFYASLEWLNENTDFEKIDLYNPEEAVKALPATVKVFICKYIGMLRDGGLSGSGVSSESIAGMSKSYVSPADMEATIRVLAMQLLGRHFIGGSVKCVADVSAFVYGR